MIKRMIIIVFCLLFCYGENGFPDNNVEKNPGGVMCKEELYKDSKDQTSVAVSFPESSSESEHLQNPHYSFYSETAKYMNEQVSNIHTTYRILMGLLTILLALGLGIFYLLYNRSVNGIKQDMETEIRVVRDQAVQNLIKEIEGKINDQFKENEISKKIERKVEDVSKQEIDEMVWLSVKDKVADVEKELRADRDLRETSNQSVVMLSSLVIRANLGDEKAIKEIRKMAEGADSYTWGSSREYYKNIAADILDLVDKKEKNGGAE